MKTNTLDIRHMDKQPYIISVNYKGNLLGYRVWNPSGKNGSLAPTKKRAWDQFNKEQIKDENK